MLSGVTGVELDLFSKTDPQVQTWEKTMTVWDSWAKSTVST